MKKNKKSPFQSPSSGFTATIIVFFSLLVSVVISFFLVVILSYFNLNPFGNLIIFSLLLLGVSAVIVLITFRIFSAKFTTSEKRIRNILDEIAKGNFDVRVPLTKSKYLNKSIMDINTVIEELNSVKIMRNDFISDFSHEFKTPIVSINGYAELLLEGNLTEKEQKEYAQIIYDESLRLSKLSKNILLLNNLNSSNFVQNKTEFSLDEQIRQCISLFTREITAKNLETECSEEPVLYQGDADLLQQVWINLLSNAIKFSPPNGSLTIILHSDEKSVTVSVCDEGCGMDEETKKHIFDQFYQGDKSRKTDGNGLGLSIVHRIVDLCHGSISVESFPDEGTTFTVTLPR